MIETVLISIVPMVVAATLSTIVVKLPALKRFRTPIDGGLVLSDGRRLFGDNKSWIGFFGLIIFGALSFYVWAAISAPHPYLIQHNFFSHYYTNAGIHALFAGAAMGFAYAVSELPNSFYKRRLGYQPGETKPGFAGFVHVAIDHTDSIIGCALVVWWLGKTSWQDFIGIIVIGATVHLLVNVLLVVVKVKKTI